MVPLRLLPHRHHAMIDNKLVGFANSAFTLKHLSSLHFALLIPFSPLIKSKLFSSHAARQA